MIFDRLIAGPLLVPIQGGYFTIEEVYFVRYRAIAAHILV